MSSFAGLHTALSGLVAQRYGLDTTGTNVANANTPGYSRQRVVIEPTTPVTTGTALFARWDGPGTGARVTDLQRVTDQLVDLRVRQERSTAEFLSVDQAAWSRVEVALGEPGDTGLTARLSSFWASWQDLANTPDSTAARTQVLQAGAGVTDTLGTLATGVTQAWADQRAGVDLLVEEVNATAQAVADLNRSVRDATAAGGTANELLDRRDALVVRLAELTGGTVREGELGTVDVFVGGTAVVRGVTASALAVDPTSAASLAEVRAGGTVRLTGTGGAVVDVPGGRIGATVQALHTTWPGVMASLDAVAADLATRVNAVHATGSGLDGAGGRDFFAGTTAADLRVAVTDPAHVAAAAAGAGALDASLADALAVLGDGPTSPDAAWRGFVSDVGVRSQAAQRRVQTQASVVGDVQAARESVSGVDLDEELTNMVMFQRAYEGSARMLTAVDQALDTLINRTGLVGR